MSLKPTDIDPTDFYRDPTPPADMHEDRLNKQLAEMESHICAALVLAQRGEPGIVTLGPFGAAVEYYGELWDESWNR